MDDGTVTLQPARRAIGPARIERLLSDTLMPRDLDRLTADGFAPLRALLGLDPPG